LLLGGAGEDELAARMAERGPRLRRVGGAGAQWALRWVVAQAQGVDVMSGPGRAPSEGVDHEAVHREAEHREDHDGCDGLGDPTGQSVSKAATTEDEAGDPADQAGDSLPQTHERG